MYDQKNWSPSNRSPSNLACAGLGRRSCGSECSAVVTNVEGMIDFRIQDRGKVN